MSVSATDQQVDDAEQYGIAGTAITDAKVKMLVARIRQEQSRIAELEAALFRYGRHKPSCQSGYGDGWNDCDCGFRMYAALRGK